MINIINEKFGLNLQEETIKKLEDFSSLFVDYNSHTNLMSKNDVSVLFEKHIFDSLALFLFLKKYNLSGNIKMLDIGTGGGFPSIPVSICFDNISVTALDSISKKIAFIQSVKENLKLKNIHPTCSRVEELGKNKKASFDIVTSRAVSDLNVILEYAIPYLKKGGFFVAYKSKNMDNEIDQAKNALKILGAKVVDKIEYELPLAEDFTRYLLIIKKEKETPNSFPRQNGQAKKNPL